MGSFHDAWSILKTRSAPMGFAPPLKDEANTFKARSRLPETISHGSNYGYDDKLQITRSAIFSTCDGDRLRLHNRSLGILER
jgi:hypothetical protein